ncbi:DUF2147 domain-containing protein [Hoeflea sp. G2-23]|uniref:DUF2147 domain-containing protein n=1 Tax=Hoeflea algicola TaxID=2983763 RepID=A0ABT3Z7E2_9HYPH|nr:DUF2147 domain-containing protein [Hoeflea algicola]MCY0147695.1 DUF2147 domain-containing protein [Hoeflea algicola]
MIRKLITAGALVAAMTAPALADPIEGAWKTQAGDNAMISSCGSSFCIKLTSGDYSGKSIGKMKADGSGKYSGSITKPSTGKTYSGSGKLSGNKLKMTGCVLKILCESQTWNKL